MYSSKTPEWGTPQAFFNKQNERYRFTLDVCATSENAKCRHYYTKEQDGLRQPWYGVVWCNPPYGRGIGLWIKKSYETARAGWPVVCLIPARTDTAYWHDYAMRGEIEFIRGRLTFTRPAVLTATEPDGELIMYAQPDPAPFPSALVVFWPGVT